MAEETATENEEFDDAFKQAASGEPQEPIADEPAPDDEQGDGSEDAELAGGDDDAGDPDDGDGESAESDGDDPWAEAPEDLRALYEEQRKEAIKWEQKFKSDAGRVSALQRKINSLNPQANNTPPQQAAHSTTAPPASQKLAELKEDMPEIADAITEALAAEREAINQQLQQQVAPIHEAEQSRFYDSQYAALDAAHSDWREKVQSDEFNAWRNAQPAAMQQMLNSDYADDVITALNYFDLSAGAGTREPSEAANTVSNIQASRQRRLQQAQSVQGQRRGQRKTVADDFDSAFAHYANKANN